MKESEEGKGFHQGEGERSGRRVGWCGDGPHEDEAESRKKLDEQKKKLQKELRDMEKVSCVPKEFQESLKRNLQQQLQEEEARSHARTSESAEKIAKDTKHPRQKKKFA